MQELEKILEEIDQEVEEYMEIDFGDEYNAGIKDINTARTIESEDFDGVALQGAGKAGEFILPDNKKAVAKATTPGE